MRPRVRLSTPEGKETGMRKRARITRLGSRLGLLGLITMAIAALWSMPASAATPVHGTFDEGVNHLKEAFLIIRHEQRLLRCKHGLRPS